VPLSLSITVLRYRSYEIDIIVNCTFIYGLLTAMLGVAKGKSRSPNPKLRPSRRQCSCPLDKLAVANNAAPLAYVP
jgi:hypothetical protein